MSSKPYLLFDAGGTLVFPDQEFLIETAKRFHIELSYEQLYFGYYRLIYKLEKDGIFPKNPWPKGYVHSLLKILYIHGLNAQKLTMAVNTRHKAKSLWTFTFPTIVQTLGRLVEQGYKMSVLSNSDGRTRKIITDTGIEKYFDYVFDSTEEKIEKPDPLIFSKVLDKLKLNKNQVIYIGDIYHVDIRGANQAGIGAIHIDPLGLYQDFPGIHLSSIKLLENWLFSYNLNPESYTNDLFPFSESKNITSQVKLNHSHSGDFDNLFTPSPGFEYFPN